MALPTAAPVVSLPKAEPVTHLSPAEVDPSVARGVPLQISSPRLDIRVPVIRIESQGGTLVPPADPQVLGWWTDGADAGAPTGGAIVTGHTVHTGGGALDRLRTLRRDDIVEVWTDRGRIVYAVREVVNLTKDELAARAGDIFSMTVPGRLVLITCTDWNGSEYLGNTVVFAEPVAAS